MGQLRKSSVITLIAAASVLASCAEYMNRRDTVSIRAGDAVEANKAIHEISPWPPYVERTDIY
jgi:hypothetical protein